MAYPVDYVIVGTALESFGLTGNNTIDGVGLNTFGFLWSCSGIWTDWDDPARTTAWTSWQANGAIETCQAY